MRTIAAPTTIRATEMENTVGNSVDVNVIVFAARGMLISIKAAAN